jgi:citrate lyase subunit beta / citryl-CoA lyase
MMPLATACTFLFVPANRPERFAKAFAAGADAVVIDLEDAVAPDDKAAARDALAQAWPALAEADRARVLVRINALGSAWHADDPVLLRRLGIGGAMVSKAETPEGLAAVAAALGPEGVMVPLVESAAGLDAVQALARAPQVLRLAFGHLDYMADLGMACEPPETELAPARHALVLASRLAGVAPPIDGVTVSTSDVGLITTDAQRSRRGGFGGKLCIHPAQVGPVQAAFAPTEAELTWSRRVVEAAATQGGAFRLDGRMVDPPVVLLAMRTLARVRSG